MLITMLKMQANKERTDFLINTGDIRHFDKEK